MHEKKIAKGVKTKEGIIMELHIDPQEPDLTFSGNRAFNTDCMEAMRQMPDKCFDLACVDPPYGIGAVNKHRGNSVIKADSEKHWDDAVPADEYFSELFRISRNQIIWGGNYFIDMLYPTRCFLIWDKKALLTVVRSPTNISSLCQNHRSIILITRRYKRRQQAMTDEKIQ